MKQHFGPSRFTTKEKIKHLYGPNGYDYEVEGYDLALDALADCEMNIFEAIDFFNRPATYDFVAKQVGILKSVMASRNQTSEDMTVLVDVYAGMLEQYPPDAIASVVREIIETEKWMPTVSEIKKKLDKVVQYRTSILRLFQQKRQETLLLERK